MTTDKIVQEQAANAECHKIMRDLETRLKEMAGTRERSLALTNLQQAKHWLQEDQHRLTRELSKAIPTNQA